MRGRFGGVTEPVDTEMRLVLGILLVAVNFKMWKYQN